MKYIDKTTFLYEMIISKGKGKLTDNALKMLELISKNMIRKFSYYKNRGDINDCLQQGKLMILLNWQSFDEKRYSDPFTYFSEVFKRGMADGFTQLYEKTRYEKWLKSQTYRKK